MSTTSSFIGTTLENGYTIESLLGKGSFGEVFRAKKGSLSCACKVEKREKTATSQLKIERKAYRILRDIDTVPRMLYFGTIGSHRFLCLDMLGPNLETVLKEQGGTFTESTAASLGIRALETLEQIHDAGILHRDIKPQNMCLAPDGAPKVYFIDFGLCKKYTTKDHGHIPHRSDKKVTGTPRFCSLRTLVGHESSRRDDVEGLMYVLFYFMLGRLPWQGLGKDTSTKTEKHRQIMESKKETTTKRLTAGLKHAERWADVFETVRNLEFTERPRYTEYTQILRRIV